MASVKKAPAAQAAPAAKKAAPAPQAAAKAAPAPKAKKAAPAPAAQAPDAPAAQAPRVRGPRGMDLQAVVTHVAPNPKREGSAAHTRYDSYTVGATVEAHLEAGLTTPDFIYDTTYGYITVDGYTPPVAKTPRAKTAEDEVEQAVAAAPVATTKKGGKRVAAKHVEQEETADAEEA